MPPGRRSAGRAGLGGERSAGPGRGGPAGREGRGGGARSRPKMAAAPDRAARAAAGPGPAGGR